MIKHILIICFVATVFLFSQLFPGNSDMITRQGDIDSSDRLIQVDCINGAKEAKYDYYQSGNLKKKAEFREGEYHGKLVSFYPNGKKEMELEFRDGVLNGKAVVWYRNGRVKMLGEFVNGDHHGQMIEMSETGRIDSLTIYKNGEICSALDFFRSPKGLSRKTRALPIQLAKH